MYVLSLWDMTWKWNAKLFIYLILRFCNSGVGNIQDGYKKIHQIGSKYLVVNKKVLKETTRWWKISMFWLSQNMFESWSMFLANVNVSKECNADIYFCSFSNRTPCSSALSCATNTLVWWMILIYADPSCLTFLQNLEIWQGVKPLLV